MIDKVRVHEVATEMGIASKDVINKATEMGLVVKSAQSTVSMEDAEKIMNYIMNGDTPEPKNTTQKPAKAKKAKEEVEEVVEVKEEPKEEPKTE
ncbi:MAG: translation initiation factor IF-2 N-terminal domain-containing protein, partial [Thiovulaceae bacterium]|nr:translation initiation factor IF-2 N-terminal domain-containing protein [Sulfurimonadaceae bacterium]